VKEHKLCTVKRDNRSAKTFAGFGFFIEMGVSKLLNKKLFRYEMLTTLNHMNRKEHGHLSSEIKNLFISTNEFQNAKTIGITISRFPEVNTRPIIEAAWSMGKQVAVPKCIKRTREMDFRLITSYSDLETIYMDLLEPIVAKTQSIKKEDINLQVVPGVLYSAEGYRIGFGGGYYDRYLTDFGGHTMSLAFKGQTNHKIPVEEHDIPVEQIITENAIHHCKKNEGYG